MAKDEKGPDFSKYEAITNMIVKDVHEGLNELERKLLYTFVDHTRANPGKEGAGLGEKIYDTAKDYVQEKFHIGKASEKNGEAIINRWMRGMFGQEISRENLEGQLKSIKEVPVGFMNEVYGKIAEGVKGAVKELVEMRVDDALEEDPETFKAYVLELGKRMGRNRPTKDDLLRPWQVKHAYLNDILPSYEKWLAQKAMKDAEGNHQAQMYDALAKAKK